MKRLFITILFFIVPGVTFTWAQADLSLKKATYEAYTRGKLDLWDAACSMAEEKHSKNNTESSLYDLIMVQYGYIASCVAEDYKKEGKGMLENAYQNLDSLKAYCGNTAEFNAINASLLAFELNLYPHRMIKIASRAVELTNIAYEQDPNNYLALACKANHLNFTPRMFGGSPTDAIPLYRKLIMLYETEGEDSIFNWHYLSAMVTLAATFEKLKNYAEACKVYEYIIEFDPKIKWINTNLYPACKQKLETQQGGK